MDYVELMDYDQPVFLPDFIQQDHPPILNNFPFDAPSSRPITVSTAFGAADEQRSDVEHKNKKMKHREIERKRRQELATLYKYLRSLLPLEYLKGTRSMSDHVEGSVKYIKDLRERIQEMSDKRDEIQRLPALELRVLGSPSTTDETLPSSSSCLEESNVVVMPCLVGVEVVISNYPGQTFFLSEVLRVLNEEGLDVASCVSTKMQGRFIHTIISEVDDVTRINLTELNEKIMKMKI